MYYYLYVVRLKVKEIWTHKFAFINNLLAQFFAYFVTLINIYILLKNIDALSGWSFYEIILLWVLNVFSYGVTGLFFYDGCNQLESQIQRGDIDIYYIQPKSFFWNYMFRNISPVFCFHVVFSSALMVYVFSALKINLSFLRCLYMILLLLCAVCIQACIMIILSAFSFRFVKSSNLVSTAIYGFRNFTTYPFSIYGKGIRFILTFIIPYAFVSYYPALFILEKQKSFWESLMIFVTPVITCVVILFTSFIWKRGLRIYNGTGS